MDLYFLPINYFQFDMGSVFGTPTPHNVTFTRSEILVSEDVVDRLRNQDSNDDKKVSSQIQTPASSPIAQTKPSDQHVPETVPEKKVDSSTAALHGLARSSEEADRRFDALLRRLSEKNDLALKLAEDEYTKVVDRLQAKYLKYSPGACCVDAQKVVMDCYKANGEHSLNCSKEVESFVRCVAAFRAARAKGPGSDVL
nr:coiled coil helix coiled coil helix [Hymenolepis microstoma]